VVAKFEQQYRRIRTELTIAFLTLIGVISVGTVGYRILQGWSWIDALYMTVITLSTVGFTEVHPLDATGRLFTIALILLGIVSFGYIVNRFTEVLIQGYFQQGIRLRQQQRLMNALSQHHIICGFGRMGRQIALEFVAETIPFIIVDFQSELIEAAEQLGYITLQGDATLDETLLKAGVERAVCLIAALSSDAENLYTVISAKALNPNIRAIARASTEEALKKLQRGGADAVVSPYITGGKRMAAAALRPQVMDFVDGILSGTNRSLYMEEFQIDAQTCPHMGKTLSEIQLSSTSKALIVAIRRADGTLVGGPTGDVQLQPGDLLMAMGTTEQLRLLNQLLSPLNAHHPRLPKHPQR
jgi:voltage-gated potassium channel